MKAKDIMQRNVITLGPLMTLREAGLLLAQRGITGAPVVDRRGSLMGVVSQSDIVRCAATHDKSGTPVFYSEADETSLRMETAPERSEFDTMRVMDVMTTNVIQTGEDSAIEELIALMLQKGIHRVVIARAGKVCGIVTTMDILRVLPGAPAR